MAIVTDDIEIEEAAAEDAELWEFVPEELRQLENPQTAIPQLAKDAEQMRVIDACVQYWGFAKRPKPDSVEDDRIQYLGLLARLTATPSRMDQ